MQMENDQHVEKKKTPPLAGSLTLGLLAAVLLIAGAPLWGWMQFGGNVPFLVLWVPVVIPLLTIAVVGLRPQSVWRAILCGVAFSLPAGLACLFLPDWYAPQFNAFAPEIRRLGWITLVLSPVVMAIAATMRQSASVENALPENKA